MYFKRINRNFLQRLDEIRRFFMIRNWEFISQIPSFLLIFN
jgi:hypothetical protein